MRQHPAGKFLYTPVHKHARGLSLIELLVTLSIAVILLTIGVPSFVDLMRSSKATGYGNDLLGDLNYARSEAITRGVRVTICHSDNESTCSGDKWADGWIIFANNNENGATGQDTRDGDDEVLRTHMAMTDDWTLNADANFANFVSFLPDGRSNQIGVFSICHNDVMNMEQAKAIAINRTGRARFAVDTDDPANGTPDRDDGREISCTP